MVGRVFNKWTVIEKGQNDKSRSITWLCKCECGSIKLLRQSRLLSGAMACQSCSNIKHNLSDHKLYHTWLHMRKRCNSITNKDYSNYGGRGIIICTRWDDFALFIEDMGDSYVEGLTLDRKDNNGNYEPDNCRWATRLEQNNNQRTTLQLEYNGNIYSESQLAKLIGVSRTTLRRKRLAGKSINQIINEIKC